jgi:hypothetical protein
MSKFYIPARTAIICFVQKRLMLLPTIPQIKDYLMSPDIDRADQYKKITALSFGTRIHLASQASPLH